MHIFVKKKHLISVYKYVSKTYLPPSQKKNKIPQLESPKKSRSNASDIFHFPYFNVIIDILYSDSVKLLLRVINLIV